MEIEINNGMKIKPWYLEKICFLDAYHTLGAIDIYGGGETNNLDEKKPI